MRVRHLISLPLIRGDLLDFVCVADLGCWHLGKMPTWSCHVRRQVDRLSSELPTPRTGRSDVVYSRWHASSGQPKPNPVAVFVALLQQLLAWEDSSLRPLGDYFRLAGLWVTSQGCMRPWPVDEVFTTQMSRR